MKHIIVIVGPTGVGKTKLSIALAHLCQGEIINGDSMQVYKNLNIGTAKIKEEEKEGIPHHLFDIKEITENYTVADYQRDCRKKIEEIKKRGHTPIIVGGTGLYIKAALYNYEFPKEETTYCFDPYTTESLYEKVKELNPHTITHPNNRQRLERELTKLWNKTESKTTSFLLYPAIVIGLTLPRDTLYSLIEKRVLKMFKNGLIEEVKPFSSCYNKSQALRTGIGYKELENYFSGRSTIEEAISLIQKNSRHYAKRQYTFFRHQFDVTWFTVHQENFEITIKEVFNYINEKEKE